jgi:hypothetical protein
VALLQVRLTHALFSYPNLWNPEPLPLPSAVLAAAQVAIAYGGGVRWAVVAAIGLALSIDSHLVSALLAPSLLVLIAARARRPAASFLAVMAIVPAFIQLDSPGSVFANTRHIAPLRLAALALVGALACAAIGAALRRRTVALPAPIAARLALHGTAAIHGAAVLVGMRLLDPHVGGALKYLEPVIPALAILPMDGALAVAAWLRRLGRARLARAVTPLVAGYVLVGAQSMWRQRRWSAEDPRVGLATMVRAARDLVDQGYRYADLAPRMLGDQASLMVGTVASFEPATRPASAPRPDESPEAIALRRRIAGLPPGFRLYPDGERGRALLVGNVRSFLRLERFERCLSATGTERRCATRSLVVPATSPGSFSSALGLEPRWRPELRPGDLPQGAESALLEETIPVEIPAGEPAHVLRVPPGGAIVAVTGVRVRGSLPAGRVVIEGDGGARGTIRIATRVGPFLFAPRGVAQVIELREDDALLVEPALETAAD